MKNPLKALRARLFPPSDPEDFYREIRERADTMTPSEFMAWLAEERHRAVIDRIRNMKDWEKMTRLSAWFTTAIVFFQVGASIVIPPFLYGTFLASSVGFVMLITDTSVHRFANARDDLLRDLEDDADTAAWWYDAYTTKTKRGKR